MRDLADTYQLLKASGACKDDLNEINEEGFAHLILKKWKDVHPGTEFRCFVRQRNLIAISPRDWPQYHEHFKTQKRDIIKDIVSLFREKIKDRFPCEDCELLNLCAHSSALSMKLIYRLFFSFQFASMLFVRPRTT